ncbi:hypothetical protein SLE2022_150300 [Rubroshorea leprosula]
MVKSKLCEEVMGASREGCNSKCASKYPNGRGSHNISTNSCTCLYHCDNPLPTTQVDEKECNARLGPCDEVCDKDCCDETCVSKFPSNFTLGECAAGAGRNRDCICKFAC